MKNILERGLENSGSGNGWGYGFTKEPQDISEYQFIDYLTQDEVGLGLISSCESHCFPTSYSPIVAKVRV